jgi:hypothetical protein
MPAEHEFEEAAGQLVVLLIGFAGVDRDGALAQACDQFHQMLLLCLEGFLALLDEPLLEQAADAEADEKVGQQAALEQAQRQGHGHRHGGGVHQSGTTLICVDARSNTGVNRL